MADVIVCIDPKSMKTTFEVNGIKGESCADVTAQLAAGREIEEEGVTEEFHYRDSLPNYRED